MTSPTNEILDRVRRIETRLCNFITSSGGEVHSVKPHWDDAQRAVIIPGMDVRISECLLAAADQPDDDDGFDVLDRNGQYVATIWRK